MKSGRARSSPIARLSKGVDDFQFEGTPINDTFATDLVDDGFIAQQRSTHGWNRHRQTHLAIAIARSCTKEDKAGWRAFLEHPQGTRFAGGVGLIFSHARPGLAERRRRRCRSAPQQRKILNITPLAATLKWLVHRRGV
jgi:hypothetical protein